MEETKFSPGDQKLFHPIYIYVKANILYFKAYPLSNDNVLYDKKYSKIDSYKVYQIISLVFQAYL